MTDINSVHDSDFVYDYPDGFDHWLLLHTNTAASFRFNEVDYETECNTMVLYPPGEPVYYHATEDIYSDDRLFFLRIRMICVYHHFRYACQLMTHYLLWSGHYFSFCVLKIYHVSVI